MSSTESRNSWNSGWRRRASELRRASVRTLKVHQLVPVPPFPPVSWNQEVRGKFSTRSLILKDLRIKSLRTKGLAAIWFSCLSKSVSRWELGRLLWPRHTSGCAYRVAIIADRGLLVSDDVHRCFVMKKGRGSDCGTARGIPHIAENAMSGAPGDPGQ
jgi:hypothetical protein